MLDLLIRNATIIDGQKNPAFQGDIAIEGDRIVEIGRFPDATSHNSIDARGLTALPGFIDMHSHADLSLIFAPRGQSLVRQGITTVVAGQCGLSPAPMNQANKKSILATFKAFVPADRTVPWERMETFNGYLEYLQELQPYVNVAQLVGQGMLRAVVMGYKTGRASPDEIRQMQDLAYEALDAGAFGLSSGLIYPPGSFTGTEELIEITRPFGERGSLYFSHVRNEAGGVVAAHQEAIRIGRQSGAGVQISHFKAAGRANWDQASIALAQIESARAEGLDVTTDMYPYIAGSTYLAAILPAWAVEGGAAGVLRRLALPWERNKIIRAMKNGESSVVEHIEWDKVLLVSSRKSEYIGHTIAELAETAGKDPYVWTLNALLKSRGDIMMVIFLMSEDNVRMQLRHPAMMIGTDGIGMSTVEESQGNRGGLTTGLAHPRSFGTYARLFGQYVRDERQLTIEEASWKSNGFPAQKLGLKDRGALRAGYKADIVLMNPQEIADMATYIEPLQYPAGIHTVLVNGQTVISAGQQLDCQPGRVLRKEH